VPETYYRLDAHLTLGSRFVWPVSAVLGPARLGPKDLGYLAWTEGRRGQVYVPLIVDARVAGREPFKTVNAIIHLSLPVETLYWKHYRLETGGDEPSPKWNHINPKVGERTGFMTVHLPIRRGGLTQVNIRAKLVDRDKMDELDFQFDH
jgi:hypothetical protein